MVKHILFAALTFAPLFSMAGDNKVFLRLRAVGDMMIGNAPTNELPKSLFFANVINVLRDADITFGNSEGTLCDQNVLGRKCPAKLPSGQLCYAFRTPTSFISQFIDAGFDVLSLSNNHIFDYYPPCADETKRTIENAGIAAIGLIDKSRKSEGGNDLEKLLETAKVVRFQGKKIAFVGFHYSNVYDRVVSINEIPVVTQMIKALKKNNDMVVAYHHGGAEGADKFRTPMGPELHKGENRGDVRKFSHAAIDAGADLVIGSGPHVLRGLEIYKNHLIIHSLGNFATYTHFNFDAPMNLGAIVEAGLNEQGEIVEGKVISTYQYWKTKPKGGRDHVVLDLDSQQRGLNEIKRLSDLDFAGSQPVFEKDGRFFNANKKD